VALWATAERPDAAQNSERQAPTQKRRILRVTCFSRFCAGPPPPAAAAWLVCVSCFQIRVVACFSRFGVRLCSTLTPGALRTGLANATDAIEIMSLSYIFPVCQHPPPEASLPHMPTPPPPIERPSQCRAVRSINEEGGRRAVTPLRRHACVREGGASRLTRLLYCGRRQ
jgi:hypothetical protein